MLRSLGFFVSISVVAIPASAAHWQDVQAERLAQWLDAADNEALPPMHADARSLRAMIAAADIMRVDALATDRALRLAHALRNGAVSPELRQDWDIAGDGGTVDLVAGLETALATDTLDMWLGGLRPRHPAYALLQKAFVAEADPARRGAIAASMERWRWMPRAMPSRYLLVNAATFELSLWNDGTIQRQWPVIVGKVKTPTPVFATMATGMIFNPWWEIPQSIVAESVGALVRNHPAEARRKGYVVMNGRYRQRPGPGNSLGQVKLVMPNSYNVYLHDTPAKALFERDVRAYSHGCIRVGNAFDLASTLLADQPEWDSTKIDALTKSGVTTPVNLTGGIPVFIAYFTAEPDSKGLVRVVPDVYGRDGAIVAELLPAMQTNSAPATTSGNQ